jgi:hydroxymethylpyrimidine pyrophosphatase-like HAD family hydrolase
VLEAILSRRVTPFIFTLEPGNRHAIYHPPLQNAWEESLAGDFARRTGVQVLSASKMPGDADITNISALGKPGKISAIDALVAAEEGLVAYSGTAMEGSGLSWIDIHHSEASKGGAIEVLKEQLGAAKILCFGDSDNDLSMFALADESYAPENAKPEVKRAASALVGHHDEDGIARFLRQRFDLPQG